MPDGKDVAQQAKNSFIKDAAKAMPVVEGVKGAEKVADNTPDRKNTPNTSKTDKTEGGENQKPANESGNDKKTTNEKDKTEGENTSKEKNPSDETEGRKVTREDNGQKTGSDVQITPAVKETEVKKIGSKGNSRVYENSAQITKDMRKRKPLNSPDVDKWYKKGGQISIDENGVWTYHDWENNIVSYPNGYPDFKTAGLVRQEAPIGPFVERNKDFAKAKAMGYEKSADGTWHHNEDGITLQEVETILHDRFRHRGGILKLKKK